MNFKLLPSYRYIPHVLLLAIIITGCTFFEMPDLGDDRITIHNVPIGLGDVQAVFLDNNYRATTQDTGRLALYVENNIHADKLMIIADLYNDDINNDILVHLIDKQNDSHTTFYYRRNQEFPYKAIINTDEREISVNFSAYNLYAMTYSVEFLYSINYENNSLSNIFEISGIILNKNILFLQDYTELTDTQNIRMRKIFTTLGLWTNLAFLIDTHGRTPSDGWYNSLYDLFTSPAGVSFFASVVPMQLTRLSNKTPFPLNFHLYLRRDAILNAKDSMPESAEELLEQLIPQDLAERLNFSSVSGTHIRPQIEVRLESNIVTNNLMPPSYLDHGYSDTYIITVKNFGNTANSIHDIIDTNAFVYAYCPVENIILHHMGGNAYYFDVTIWRYANERIELHIERNHRPGYAYDGELVYLLMFRQDVIINGISTGVQYAVELLEPLLRQDIFILNYTVFDNQ